MSEVGGIAGGFAQSRKWTRALTAPRSSAGNPRRGEAAGSSDVMPNDTGSGRAICPYYQNEDSRSLRCEGFLPGTVLRMCFAGEKRKARWQEEVCSHFGYDQACPLAAALTAHLEQETETECGPS